MSRKLGAGGALFVSAALWIACAGETSVSVDGLEGRACDSRDILVRIHEPTRTPPENKWPWVVPVKVDGRNYNVPGEDPLDAIESGARHAAILLRELHGDALDPPIEPRS